MTPEDVRPIDEANVTVNLFSLLVNLEILGTVREHLDIVKETRNLKAQEIELKRVQAANDLIFYESALNKLDEILNRLP